MAHGTARTTVRTRRELVALIESGMPVAGAAARCGTSRVTAYKWLKRSRETGDVRDRSSRPRRMPRLVDPQLGKLILDARKATGYGPARLGGELGIAGSTVWKVLRRAGENRLPRQPRGPIVRYERARPGELLHVDSKKLGRISGGAGHRIHGDRTRRSRHIGWEHVHVAIDDRTRLAYVEIASDEKGETCAAFLERACAWYEQNGIRIERVITDNAKAYGSFAWQRICRERSIARRFTRPYRPQTNGKAERLIRTLLTEWAYADAYESSDQRGSTLPRWCDNYNTRRYHTAIKTTPWNRAVTDAATVNNVCEPYI